MESNKNKISKDNIKFLGFFLLVMLFHGHQLAAQQEPARKPNLIFILADDLGYGNISAFNPNSVLKTPNLDRLTNQGIKFTRFYSGNTVCAPSRCALMTGKHMGTAYIRGNSKAKDGKGALRPEDLTLSEILKKSGYTTGMFGKWGLGDVESKGAPHLKGFDQFYGYLDQSHAHDYYTDSLYEIRNGITQVVNVSNQEYTQDLILNKSIAFIKEHKDQPFFLYLPFTLPHAELIVPNDLLKEFQHKDGSSVFGEEEYFSKKGNYDDQAQPHAAFAAMVKKLDDDIGKIVLLIETLGLEDDTYIFFSSDNGPHQEGGADPAFFNSWGPLRGIKRDLYEGGIRVPLIVKVPGNKNTINQVDEAWAFWDILPTFTAIANANTPKNIDGISFLETIKKGNQQNKHQELYWQFNEKGVLKEAITMENWKLIRFKEKDKKEVLELYDLATDIGEQVNIANAHPDIVKKLYAQRKKVKKDPENPNFNWSDFED